MANNGNVDLGDLANDDNVFQLAGSLEPALPLPAFTLAALGMAGAALDGFAPALTLPAVLSPGASTADGMRLPAFLLDGRLDTGTYIAGRIGLPTLALAGSLEPPLALPSLALAASGAAGQLLDAQPLSLPGLTLTAQAGDHHAVLPPLQASGELLAGTTASASLTLARADLAGIVLQDGEGAGVVRLALLQLDASLDATAVNHAEVTLDMLELAATGLAGTVGNALLTVPLFESASELHMEAIGNATILVPVFSLDALGHTVQIARPAAVSVVLNTRLKGVTRYEGLAANSFASYAGVQLAATPDGIVALMGETDLGAPIAAAITSGTSDLGNPARKRVEAAFVGYRASGEMEMTLITDEHHEYTYRMVPRQILDTLHATRVKFGRGVDGNFWQWKLANLHGGDFSVGSMQMNVNPLSRTV